MQTLVEWGPAGWQKVSGCFVAVAVSSALVANSFRSKLTTEMFLQRRSMSFACLLLNRNVWWLIFFYFCKYIWLSGSVVDVVSSRSLEGIWKVVLNRRAKRSCSLRHNKKWTCWARWKEEKRKDGEEERATNWLLIAKNGKPLWAWFVRVILGKN